MEAVKIEKSDKSYVWRPERQVWPGRMRRPERKNSVDRTHLEAGKEEKGGKGSEKTNKEDPELWRLEERNGRRGPGCGG